MSESWFGAAAETCPVLIERSKVTALHKRPFHLIVPRYENGSIISYTQLSVLNYPGYRYLRVQERISLRVFVLRNAVLHTMNRAVISPTEIVHPASGFLIDRLGPLKRVFVV
jgi:hypothetical protein